MEIPLSKEVEVVDKSRVGIAGYIELDENYLMPTATMFRSGIVFFPL